MLWLYFGIVLCSSGTFGAVHLPTEIQKCSLSDSEFNNCMAKSITKALSAFREGSKDFGLPVLEPFEINELNIEADPGKSIALNQNYKNVKMYGSTDSKVVKFSRKVDNKTCRWEIEVHTSFTRVEADYSLSGQILVFPINAHGKSNVTLYNIVNQHKLTCENYMKKGKLHKKAQNYSINMKVEKCVFDLDNLFPGNEQISHEVKNIFKENSLEIFQEIKYGFEEVLAKLYKDCANSVLSRVPLDELYLP